jgi:hypothetical protein
MINFTKVSETSEQVLKVAKQNPTLTPKQIAGFINNVAYRKAYTQVRNAKMKLVKAALKAAVNGQNGQNGSK